MNEWFFKWTAQLSRLILLRQFRAWYVKYTAWHGSSFVGLQISTASKHSKRCYKNFVFITKMTVFSKLLAEFWRYRTLETTKRCAIQSSIIHIPSSTLSNQSWWTSRGNSLPKTETEPAGSMLSLNCKSRNIPKMEPLLRLTVGSMYMLVNMLE